MDGGGILSQFVVLRFVDKGDRLSRLSKEAVFTAGSMKQHHDITVNDFRQARLTHLLTYVASAFTQ
jgi:hypothetical protein